MYNRIMNGRTRLSFRTVFIIAISVMGALLMFPVSQVSAENADPKTIVYIDTGKILEVHPAFVQAKKDFESEVQGMQEKLQGLSEEEQMLAQQQMQQQMQQRGEQLQEEALDKMRQDLQKIADEKGYEYVFDANSLIVGGKDVTDEVVKAMKQDGQAQE